MVILRAFIKKTEKTPEGEIDLALAHATRTRLRIVFEPAVAR